MRLTQWLEPRFFRLAARYCELCSPPRTAPEGRRRWRVVAHRGAPGPGDPVENTLEAFDRALRAGVDGLELDVRWTHDRQPVVIHDPDLQRVFGLPHRVTDMTLADLNARCPRLPTLEEVVARYGRRHHLMVEFKSPAPVRPEEQNRLLGHIFRRLRAGRDYHLMALEPELFGRLFFAPAAACLPIARTRVRRFSRLALENGWGGLTGHYMLVPQGTIDRHHRRGQCVGTGFADTPACLHREAARGVDWIFTDHATALQRELSGLSGSCFSGSLTKARSTPPATNNTRMETMLNRAAS